VFICSVDTSIDHIDVATFSTVVTSILISAAQAAEH